jgi:hypothetical protein
MEVFEPDAKEMLSMKAEVLGLSGDDDESAVLLIWPSDDDLRDCRLSRADVQDVWVSWEPLAASVGLGARASTGADAVTTLTFSRAPVGAPAR